MKKTIVAVVTAFAFVLMTAGVAQADPVRDDSAPPNGPASSSQVQILPESNTVVTETSYGAAELTLPGLKSEADIRIPENLAASLFEGRSGEEKLTTSLSGAVLKTYTTSTGTQTLISILSSQASKEYRFPLSLPAGSTVAVQDDGSVDVVASDGNRIGGYRVPWAYDASGAQIATSFRIDQGDLVQKVEFTESNSFPITADPSDAWGWVQCIATVGVEIVPFFVPGGNFAVAGVKLVAKFGSVQKGLEVLIRAWNAYHDWGKYVAFIQKTYGNVFADVLGVTALKSACFS